MTPALSIASARADYQEMVRLVPPVAPAEPPNTVEPWVGITVVAKHLSVSKRTIDRWCKRPRIEDRLPHENIPRGKRFKLSMVDAHVMRGNL